MSRRTDKNFTHISDEIVSCISEYDSMIKKNDINYTPNNYLFFIEQINKPEIYFEFTTIISKNKKDTCVIGTEFFIYDNNAELLFRRNYDILDINYFIENCMNTYKEMKNEYIMTSLLSKISSPQILYSII